MLDKNKINLQNIIIDDNFIIEHVFDKLGRINYEYKYLMEEPKIIEYLLNRYNDCNNIDESVRRIYYHIDIVPKCPICGNPCKFIGGSKVYKDTCNNIECKNKFAYQKHIETFKLNHNGLTNNFQLPEVIQKIQIKLNKKRNIIKEKAKQTWIKKYGVDNPAKSEYIKEKSKQTCLEKYGVEYSFKSENNKEKSQQTLLEKYGVKNMLDIPEIRQKGLEASKTTEVKEKIKQTCLKKYGVDHYTKTQEYKILMSNPEIQKLKQQKEYETKKKNKSFNISNPEKNSYKLLKEKYLDIKYQYKSELYPFICDFYIPSLDLYIECNYHWTHGGKPFENTKEDNIKLKQWKSKNTKYYNNAINTWTIRDVKKRNIAKENNLNYLEFFTILKLETWLNNNYEAK